MMRLVIVESPFSAPTPKGIAANVRYARACVLDCLRRGESPFASHLLHTQPGILDDANPGDRALGISAGLEWLKLADASVVYTDRGISNGMREGIAAAEKRGVPVEFRKLQVNVE